MIRKILILIIFIVFPFVLSSQTADGRYASRKTMDGTIFFISPQKLGLKDGLKAFEYDMTLLTWKDSVTINFTFESESMEMPEAINFKAGETEIQCESYSPLFIDIKKDHYEIRVTSKISIDELEKILASSSPLIFEVKQAGKLRMAAYNTGKWKKDRKKLNDIFKLYLYSR